MTDRRFPLALACVALLGACREPAPETPPPAPPAHEQIAADLVGARFTFFEDEQGGKTWTIEEGEVRELRVVDGVTAGDGASHRARLRLALAAQNRTIRGELVLTYRRSDDAWALDEVARPGANWTVEEIAAVVYEVRRPPPSDTTFGPADVWLEPMFRYHDGAYVDPFGPYEARIRAVVDSTFRTDSLRRAAVGALEGEIARRWLNPAWTVFLLGPGAAPEPVGFRTREAAFDGCRYVAGVVRAPSPAMAEWARMATSSSTMGGALFPGRTPTPQEEERLAVAARGHLATLVVPAAQLDRLRAGRALAVDLDGDGTEEFVGAYGVAGEQPGMAARSVVVVAEPGPAAMRVVGARASASDDGWGTLRLVGAVDVDGDGVLEVVAREAGYESHRFVVLSRGTGGRWTEVYTGGGGGC